jgi:hypothetical protein
VYDSSDKCLGQEGIDGFWITVDRVFYQGGKEVKREPIATHYKPAPKVICGKDPKAKPKPSDKPSAGPSAKPSTSPGSKPSSKPSSQPSSKPSTAPTTGPSDTFQN